MQALSVKATGGLLYLFLAFSALIFLPSWTLDYWEAWTFLGVFMASISAILLYLARNDPKLLARRIRTTEKEKNQKVIRFLVNLTFSALIVVSALDHRAGWSAVRSYVPALGDILVTLGLLMIFLVFKANSFSAQTVETEAGQEVISTGPYALVRHPMYAGGLVMMAGIPLALGSYWGLLLIVLFAPVIAWRILDEEKVLGKDLPGYAEYRSKVKYRLIPCVW